MIAYKRQDHVDIYTGIKTLAFNFTIASSMYVLYGFFHNLSLALYLPFEESTFSFVSRKEKESNIKLLRRVVRAPSPLILTLILSGNSVFSYYIKCRIEKKILKRVRIIIKKTTIKALSSKC